MNRREFLGCGVVFASSLYGCKGAVAPPPAGRNEDFFFLQLSDTHWGYRGPGNPDADRTLPLLAERIARLERKPAFVVFTGDLTHTTDEKAERNARMARFREIVTPMGVTLKFLPGEHDAAPDNGEAFREHFGATQWTFDHGGVRFVAIDNATDGTIHELGILEQAITHPGPLVVFAHRPLFELYAPWDWSTKDGARALEILSKHPRPVTVFYGHIHQEHHQTTGNIVHHAARSLVFPLPAPGSAPKKAPLPWDPASLDHGLGHRAVRVDDRKAAIEEVPWTDGRAVIATRCVPCHSKGNPAEDHDFSALEKKPGMEARVRSGAMPPKQPLSDVERSALLDWLR